MTDDQPAAGITNLATTTDLVFLDCETTGLDPHPHGRIWEFYAERHNTGGGIEVAHLHPTHLPHDDITAVPLSYIVDYHQRVPPKNKRTPATQFAKVAAQLLRTRGDNPPPTVIGANPHFDTAHLTSYLEFGEQTDGSHWRRLDIEPAAHAHLHTTGNPMPFNEASLTALAEAMNIPTSDAHTAKGDVTMVKDLYQRIYPT